MKQQSFMLYPIIFCCYLHINKRRIDRLDQIDEHAAVNKLSNTAYYQCIVVHITKHCWYCNHVLCKNYLQHTAVKIREGMQE